ncbi:conserved Plasmodium protein, unknown function [Plasmodium malariae]|uniref:Uncharacterized protein n=1 Tax=Plasmodium malariae TaxID=5858 RepID=A0A1A8W7N8_PLAMA|nr:conserved Plasmodium protein, unknown function [Plasmodium malariae]
MNSSICLEEYNTWDKRFALTSNNENVQNYNMPLNLNYSDNCYENTTFFDNSLLKSNWESTNTSLVNYNSPLSTNNVNFNYAYNQNNDIYKRKNKYGELKLNTFNKEKIYFAKNENEKDYYEKNALRNTPFEINNFSRNTKKFEFLKNSCNFKKGLKKNCIINDKYNKITRELSCIGDMYIKNINRCYACNCSNIYKQIYKNENCNVIDMKQIHNDLIYLIIKYLYYERILPEANEIKRKINKYFPECPVLNNNFINICREDKFKKFEIYKANSYEKEEKKGKIFFKKSFNNENICIYLRGISKDFFINPNDDTENIFQYIPLIFIHLIDRFRIQSL